MKIEQDVNRFKDIVKGRVKSDLKRFVSSSDLIGQQGAKSIRIPISSINIPRFTFGSPGGSGMGPGNEGDPFGQPGKGKPGEGKAGDEKGEHDFSMEFTPDELAQILIDQLQLPDLQDKGKGKVAAEKNKYNQISRVGNDGLRHTKRTYLEALKRQISTGSYNPSNPTVIPTKPDYRYKTFSTKEKPEINAAVFNIIDVSGSMGEEQRQMVKTIVFWTDLLLRHAHKDIENVFIIHDTEAQAVSREDFFSASSGGGTKITSAYKLCADIIESNFPFSDWNNYVFQYSDGDTYADEKECIELLNERLIPNTNMIAYGQVRSQGGSGQYIDWLKANDSKVVLAQIDSVDDTMKTIGTFFGGNQGI